VVVLDASAQARDAALIAALDVAITTRDASRTSSNCSRRSRRMRG